MIPKLRAWCKEEKCMFDVIRIDFKEELVYGEDETEEWEYDFADVEVMQFTTFVECGKDDGEDKLDIYVGDVLLCSRHELGELYQVIVEDITHLPNLMFGSNLNWRRVIGNIYENPRFLKQEKEGREKLEEEKRKGGIMENV